MRVPRAARLSRESTGNRTGMTTLLDYARQHFPRHTTESSEASVPLSPHTVVAHVVGTRRARLVEEALRRTATDRAVAHVVVRPTDPTVLPTGGEDPDGIVDLPYRRFATGALGGALLGFVALGIVGLVVTDAWWGAAVLAGFGAVLGGVVAAMLSGMGRHAGDRAWEQPHAPDRTIVVVAAMFDDEHQANVAAAAVEMFQPDDVRIVAADGAWHSPLT